MPNPADPPKLPVTVVVPVKNEERNLAACLARLTEFAAVIVVDSDSTDATERIAREHGAAFVNFRWNGGFPKKRNWLLANHPIATDWILFLDADEFVTPEFCAELRATLSGSNKSGFWLNYGNVFLGRTLRHGVPQRKLALMRRGAGAYERVDDAFWSRYDMEIHEHLVLDGEVGEIDARIIHDSRQTIHQFVAKHNEYASWEAGRFRTMSHAEPSRLTRRQAFKYRSMNRIWYAPAYFCGEYFAYRGFLDGYPGFVHAMLKAIYFRIVYFKIRETQDEFRS